MKQENQRYSIVQMPSGYVRVFSDGDAEVMCAAVGIDYATVQSGLTWDEAMALGKIMKANIGYSIDHWY